MSLERPASGAAPAKRELRIGSFSRPMPGEQACGDRIVVLQRTDDVLCAVIDGLGHGENAAVAAEAAAGYISSHADDPLDSILLGCDRAIASTRGVAATLVRVVLPAGTLEHAGIGNVELTAHSREPIRPVTRPGVVGSRVRKVNVTSHRIFPGDRIAVFTDGVSARFQFDLMPQAPAQAQARRIVEEHGRSHDDASCLVIHVG